MYNHEVLHQYIKDYNNYSGRNIDSYPDFKELATALNQVEMLISFRFWRYVKEWTPYCSITNPIIYAKVMLLMYAKKKLNNN
jgi:hypothetical protein